VFGGRTEYWRTRDNTECPIMRHYELMTVLPGTMTEDEVIPFIDRVKVILSDLSVTDVAVENMGKTRLSYPMKHIRYGYYYTFVFEAEPGIIAKAQTQLRLIPEFLRVLFSTFDPKMRAETAQRKAKMAAHQAARVAVQEEKKEENEDKEQSSLEEKEKKEEKTESSVSEIKEKKDIKEEKIEDTEEEKKEVIEPKVEPKKEKKVSMEEIDKKLDEILGKDI